MHAVQELVELLAVAQAALLPSEALVLVLLHMPAAFAGAMQALVLVLLLLCQMLRNAAEAQLLPTSKALLSVLLPLPVAVAVAIARCHRVLVLLS